MSVRKRVGVMLAKPFAENLFNRLGTPIIVQPKIEGDRLRAVMKGEYTTLYSSTASIRKSLPHIHKELAASEFTNIELDGEAYRHGWKHSQIRSVVSRTKTLHPSYEAIEYWVYDIVSDDPQWDRLSRLKQYITKISNFKHIKYVPYKIIYTLDEFQYYYDVCLKFGFEGIIARHFSAPYVRKQTSYLLKLKPRLSEYFKILDVKEEISKDGIPKKTFGAFICVTDNSNELFTVGSGPTKVQRDLIWEYREDFKGRKVKVRFQGYTNARNVPKMQSIDSEWLADVEEILS